MSGQRIIISDNCSGIKINPEKPIIIFGSQKRNDPATNGMFGMGMFSFLSMCDKMAVETTRENSDKLYKYEITKDIFNGSK
ncbi:MAG: ATP-binding protein [Ignavibacteria bacterium]|nr:ATP-binding protein [Ignavibacteria bacterium]